MVEDTDRGSPYIKNYSNEQIDNKIMELLELFYQDWKRKAAKIE